MKVFNKYSLYYNLLYQDKDYESEAEYINQLIKKYHNNPKSIFNMGCGTGKHDFLLLKKGYKIIGFDISDKMIEEAQLKKTKHFPNKPIEFIKGDIQNIRLNKKFDVVTSLFHVMSYQTTNEALDNSFKTAKTHLKDNGLFIFDCWNGPGVITEKPEKRIKEMQNEEYKVIRYAQPEIFPNANCVNVNYKIELLNLKGELIDTIKETHKMRYLFRPEIEFLAKKNQLAILDQFEWMNLTEPSFNSWTTVYILSHG